LSFFLNEKSCGFIQGLYKHEPDKNKKESVLNIGRAFYSCNNSIYDAIDRFEKWGLIQVIRQKRDLKIKFTKDGLELIRCIGFISQFR
jgi:hypothetical protein